MTEENKNLLVNDLCCRLPYRPKGILLAGGETERQTTGTLCGIDLKNPEFPLVEVMVPGFKTPWNCSIDLFIPILYPFSMIYKEINGKIPWVTAEERFMGVQITDVKFKCPEITWEDKKWSEVSYLLENGKESRCYGTATFNSPESYQVAYELGIDISGLIEKGLAYEPKTSTF